MTECNHTIKLNEMVGLLYCPECGASWPDPVILSTNRHAIQWISKWYNEPIIIPVDTKNAPGVFQHKFQ